MKRALIRAGGVAIAAGLAVAALGFHNARADPIVRQLRVNAAVPQTSVVLLADLHVAGPDMPPDRLARIVAQTNSLKPDLVLIAGDFVSDKRLATRRYSTRAAIAPLAKLRATHGTIAVLGNHDHWRDAGEVRRELAAAGVKLLDNDAIRVGPLVVGGVDDAMTGHADMPHTVTAMRRIGGLPILLSHSPDAFPDMPPEIGLMIAGHTHCGQVHLPFVGALTYASDYGDRYGCGIVRERGRTVVVSAGLGTSVLPIRFGAPPDLWRITIGR